jgi:hypothetical protein
MINRISIFAYGAASYALFLATFLYALGFVGGFGVPHTIDGPLEGSIRRPWPSTWGCSGCSRSSTA